MAHGYDSMMTPAIEDLLERTESKFVLVALAAKRSREITNYLGQLAGGSGAIVPPQVISTSAKALSIALEEVAAGKVEVLVVDDADDEAGLSGVEPHPVEFDSQEQPRGPQGSDEPAPGAGA